MNGMGTGVKYAAGQDSGFCQTSCQSDATIVRFFQRVRAEARTHFQRDGHRLEPRGRRRDVEDYDSRLVRRRRMMHLEGERLPGSI